MRPGDPGLLSAQPLAPPPKKPKGGVMVTLTLPLIYTTMLFPAPISPPPSAKPKGGDLITLTLTYTARPTPATRKTRDQVPAAEYCVSSWVG